MRTLIASVLLLVSTTVSAVGPEAKRSIEEDKFLHLGVGFAFGAGAGLVMNTPEEACAVASVPGFLKELHDQKKEQAFDYQDLAFSTVGACLGAYIIHDLMK